MKTILLSIALFSSISAQAFTIEDGGDSVENLEKCAHHFINESLKDSELNDLKIDDTLIDDSSVFTNIQTFRFTATDENSLNFTGKVQFKYSVEEIDATYDKRSGDVVTPEREEITCTTNNLARAKATILNSRCYDRRYSESSTTFDEEIIFELRNRADHVILERHDTDYDSRYCRPLSDIIFMKR